MVQPHTATTANVSQNELTVPTVPGRKSFTGMLGGRYRVRYPDKSCGLGYPTAETANYHFRRWIMNPGEGAWSFGNCFHSACARVHGLAGRPKNRFGSAGLHPWCRQQRVRMLIGAPTLYPFRSALVFPFLGRPLHLASSRRPSLNSSVDTNLLSPARRLVRVCSRIVDSIPSSSYSAYSASHAELLLLLRYTRQMNVARHQAVMGCVPIFRS
jgi:hypothetical protein